MIKLDELFMRREGAKIIAEGIKNLKSLVFLDIGNHLLTIKFIIT